MNKGLRYKIWEALSFLLPYRVYLKVVYRIRVGHRLSFRHPKSFTEKIQVLKCRSRNYPDFTRLVDKVAVKDYVGSIIGLEYIIPTYGVWNKPEDIDFSSLPENCILKCTHDSSKGIVVRDHQSIDVEAIIERFHRLQKKNYYYHNREYPYKRVPKRIIAEKYLVNGNDFELKDYKFYCFNGRAEYCQVIANRRTDETIDFYDREWIHQDFIGLNAKAHHSLAEHLRPELYNDMLRIADQLSSIISFPFVRIDLYYVNHHVYFGEITFFPASGLGHFRPQEWDNKLGDMLKL